MGAEHRTLCGDDLRMISTGEFKREELAQLLSTIGDRQVQSLRQTSHIMRTEVDLPTINAVPSSGIGYGTSGANSNAIMNLDADNSSSERSEDRAKESIDNIEIQKSCTEDYHISIINKSKIEAPLVYKTMSNCIDHHISFFHPNSMSTPRLSIKDKSAKNLIR